MNSPNTALEPTPVTPVRLRCGFRVGGSHRRRGSAFYVRLHMRLLTSILMLSVLVVVSGCKQQHTIAGDYRLEQFEDGQTYYLHKCGHDDSADGGSIIGGTVLRLGWSSR